MNKQPQKFLDSVREAIHLKTEEAYIAWMKRYIFR